VNEEEHNNRKRTNTRATRDWQWRWEKKRFSASIENGFIEFKFNGDKWTVYAKEYEKVDNDGNVIIRERKHRTGIDFTTTINGTKECEELLGKRVFSFPKPVDLILHFTKMLAQSNDIVLDFFSGSATTAHAVIQLNAEDGGKRRFIMVQLPEPTDEKSEAYKAGCKNISEIGKKRICQAGNKIKKEKGFEAQNLDIGFKVFKLDTSNIRKWQPDYGNLKSSIIDYRDNYVKDRCELDVVYEIMIKYGLDLSYPVDEYTIAGKTVYSIGSGMLMICLADELTIDLAHGILAKIKEISPESARVVFRDSGFKTDAIKTNIKEILKCGGVEEFISL
ncbi:MAG TPA: DNA methyltransferase, partial [Thermotogota bacterium]|jgi:adenine-specific DNA-methyltransferase|nr:DNA methyltransferase [Thermotogota bacterium]